LEFFVYFSLIFIAVQKMWLISAGQDHHLLPTIY